MGLVLLALDFETANRSPSSACQIGLVRVDNGVVTAEASRMIRPPDPEFVFSYLHGITWDLVSGAPTWGELWPDLAAHFRGVDFLAAHNAPFDRGVLAAICADHGIPAPKTPFLDTVEIARSVWGIYPTKLNMVCQRLGISLNHHEALSDARACAQILLRAAGDGWSPPSRPRN